MRLYFDLIVYWLDASVSSDFESSGRFSELHTHIEFHLTMTALIVRLRTSSLPMRTRDFHPFEHAHGAHNKETAPPKRCCSEFCKINAPSRASLISTLPLWNRLFEPLSGPVSARIFQNILTISQNRGQKWADSKLYFLSTILKHFYSAIIVKFEVRYNFNIRAVSVSMTALRITAHITITPSRDIFLYSYQSLLSPQ